MGLETEVKIAGMCDSIRDLLIEKNRSYGDSALRPNNIFSRHGPEVLIRSRIDDKLNRIKNNQEGAFGEDVVKDLIGYLVLLLIVREEAEEAYRAYVREGFEEASEEVLGRALGGEADA